MNLQRGALATCRFPEPDIWRRPASPPEKSGSSRLSSALDFWHWLDSIPALRASVGRTANGAEGRELATARWGMPFSQRALMEATKKRVAKLEASGKPVDFAQLLRMEPDGGTTNIRNVKSKHWTAMAWSRKPLRGAVQLLQRVQQGRRRRHLVCAR
jgi:hypothetical protein